VPDPPETAGGGATTLEPAATVLPPFGERPLATPPASPLTLGGGGTTWLSPKIFPMIVLTNDPLLGADGGGWTTALLGSGGPPLGMWRRSAASVEGGGAITAGAGKVSFAVRAESLTGADTGGGTTAGSTASTEVRGVSFPDNEGDGGTMFALTVGAVRWLRLESSASTGAITFVLRDGADRPC